MPIASALQSAGDKLEQKIDNWLNGGKLEKARLYQAKSTGIKDGFTWNKEGFVVQFNPSELSVSRSVLASGQRHPLGRNPAIRASHAAGLKHAMLSLTLYFDDVSGFEAVDDRSPMGLSAMKGKKPTGLCRQIATLLRYNPEQHHPPKIKFLWGSFCFVGDVVNTNVQYTMFASDGSPVRAKISLSVSGEEEEIIQQDAANTPCSPNRTKERLLAEGDQLWMLAQREYDDPAMWKTIAEANGIRNPRKMDRATTLKIPSVK